MSTSLISEEEGFGFLLTEFHGSHRESPLGVCYQITQTRKIGPGQGEYVQLTDAQMAVLVEYYEKRRAQRVREEELKKNPRGFCPD